MKKINVLISTFFGYGYLTKIPGTVTSLVTTIFIYIAYEHLGYNDLKFSIIFFTLLFFYSFYAVKDAESEFVNKDPRQIVIDEVLGQAMPLILVLYLSQNNQLSLSIEIYYVLSFILFRFFDITKIGPIKKFEKLPGGFGIITDDLIAGLCAFLTQAAILTFINQPLIIKTL